MNTLKSPLIPVSNISDHMRNDFLTDAYQPRSHGLTLTNCHAFDTAANDTNIMPTGHEAGKLIRDCAHRDHIQPIPPSPPGLFNQQYALAILNGLSIINCKAHSDAYLQGIGYFDGYIKELVIKGYHITTKAQHIITINGCISAELEDNLEGEIGQPAPIYLGPARAAGSHNIHILSHKDKDDEYQPIHAQNLSDHRRTPIKRKGHRNLINFDLKRFYGEIEKAGYPKSEPTTRTDRYCKIVDEIAMKYGDLV